MKRNFSCWSSSTSFLFWFSALKELSLSEVVK
jgi:hypothetical protein